MPSICLASFFLKYSPPQTRTSPQKWTVWFENLPTTFSLDGVRKMPSVTPACLLKEDSYVFKMSRSWREPRFLFGSLKCYTTRLPYWIIFSSRNSSVSHLRPGFNLKVITFGQSSDALSCCRGLGGFWGNWFYSVADASLGQMRNQTTAQFAEKPTSAV